MRSEWDEFVAATPNGWSAQNAGENSRDSERKPLYYDYWIRKFDVPVRSTDYVVVRRKEDKKFYVSLASDVDGTADIGPFNLLEDAAAVCVMYNHGNKT